jgi:phospholipase/carboxylesterase
MAEAEAPIVIETGPNPDTSIIWLHGLGADGHDFEPIVPELRLPAALSIRFIFPHAPFRPVSLNGGYTMRAWYDLAMEAQGIRQHEGHIRESERVIADLVDRERAAGIDSRRIVLAGFSQGAAMALHTGLRYPHPLAGVMALSMPLPLAEKIPTELNPANAQLPVFLAHGTRDPIVPFMLGERAHQLLTSLAIPVDWHVYDMEHTVSAPEIADIRGWLLKALAK